MTPIRIDGATRLYAIVGDPIAQVKSPELYCELFAAGGMNAVMLPMQILPDHFDATMQALTALGNLDGLLVTVPYKALAVRFASRLGPTAGRIGALNALRREKDGSWTGDMFDGAGFVRAAQRKQCVLKGRRVALFGAGGAGSAIACELASAGVESVAIIDPVRDRAAALAAKLAREFPNCRITAAESVPAGSTMIVNASTVGMRAGDGLPGDVGTLDERMIVGDVIVSQNPTPLIQAAIRQGSPFVIGREMLAGQSDALLSFFRQALV
jgi:shikimate dehydrogenase